MKLLRQITVSLLLSATLLGGIQAADAKETDNLVEQIQAIHRLSQTLSWQSLTGLVGAMNSPFPLARRKASQGLLELVRNSTYTEQDKALISQKVQKEVRPTDPVVQKNVERIVSQLEEADTVEAQPAVIQPPVAQYAAHRDQTTGSGQGIPENAMLLMEFADESPRASAVQRPVVIRHQ